jgi:hypothetical protein
MDKNENKLSRKSHIFSKHDHHIPFETNSTRTDYELKRSFLNDPSNENVSEIKEKKEARKTILKEVLYNSFAQAVIRSILTPHLILKIFLLLLIVSSSVLAWYLVIKSIMTYFTYGVSTTSRSIYETPTLFPKVTFCNLNQYATEYAYNLSQKGVSSGNNLSNEDKRKLGHDLKDILVECWFNLNPCNWTDFLWSYDNTYGNCYTFNSGFDAYGKEIELKKSKIAGPAFGLQLGLYANLYEKLMDDVDILGAIFHIGNSSYSTYYLNSGLLVSSGFQTSIAVDREFKSILPKPYSNCEIDSASPKFRPNMDLYNLIAESKFAYTQQLCFVECIQAYYIKNYNCTITYLPSLYNVSECDVDFIWSILKTDFILKGDFIDEVCLPSCPLECDQMLYKTSQSSGQLTGNKYFISKIKNNPNLAKDFINRTIDKATAKYSFVLVKVFYDSLSFTLTTETPQMDIVSLFASIGGNLGLFLGVSVFSLCEIFEVILQINFFT